ncbi:MAG: adenylate kinase family protein [Candidatus Methanoplasma sp.]|jgi:adenylate kinase|nr:adenylate kinase family protein [Candidatus Methanoplasma sp.]
MVLIAITGTPGTGKSSLSDELRKRGRRVLDVNEHIRSHGLLGDRDEGRDTFCVDVDGLNDSLGELRDMDEIIFLDSHLSHCVDSRAIIVLRCHPDELAKRLAARGYSEQKIMENVQAEVLDVILCEASESDIPVFEIDCTSGPVSYSADAAEEIVDGNTDKYLPGNVSWLGELEKWF